MTVFKGALPYYALATLLVVSSGAAQAETLEQAVASALENHPSIEAVVAREDAAFEERKVEKSGYFPKLSLSATAGRMYGDNSTSRGLSVTRGAGYSYLGEGTVSATQMIFDGFETKNRVSSATARQKAVGMEVADAKESLALRTSQAYLNVLRSRAALAMLTAHKAKVADYLSRIKVSVDEGISDDAEYQQARDVKVILDGFITDYEGQVRRAEADYFEVTGHLPDESMSPPKPKIDFIPAEMTVALSYAKDHHPSLKSAIYNSKAKSSEIQAERAGLYPDVKGELSYLKSDKEDLLGGELVDSRAVVRMNWDFETGGAQLAKIRKKKYEHYEAQSRMREIERALENQLRLAYADLETAQERLVHQRNRVDLNTKLFDTYQVQFEGARITLLQLMQADNQLFNTKLEKLNGEYAVLASQYNVLANMGRLQESLILSSAEAQPTAAHEQN